MRTTGRVSLPVLPVLLATSIGCSTGRVQYDWNATARPAIDLPEVFTAEPAVAPGTCPGHMIDPRRGARLTLRRSGVQNGVARGDYDTGKPLGDTGSYGLREAEYLRIDCATGKALGIVSSVR